MKVGTEENADVELLILIFMTYFTKVGLKLQWC